MSEKASRRATLPQPEHTKVYYVGNNDTLTGLSIRFNVPSSVIQSLNKLSTTYLFPGMKLFLPDTVDIPEVPNSPPLVPIEAPNLQQRRASKTLELPQLPDLSSIPLPSNINALKKKGSSPEMLGLSLSPPSSSVTDLFEKEKEKEHEQQNSNSNSHSNPHLDHKAQSSPAILEDYVKEVGWHRTDFGCAKGTIIIKKMNILFHYDKNSDAFKANPQLADFKIELSEIKGTKIIPETNPKLVEQFRKEIGVTDTESQFVCFRIESVQQNASMWTNVSYSFCDIIVKQEDLRNIYETIVDNGELSRSENVPQKKFKMTMSVTNMLPSMENFGLENITSYFKAPVNLFQREKEKEKENQDVPNIQKEDEKMSSMDDLHVVDSADKIQQEMDISDSNLVTSQPPPIDDMPKTFTDDGIVEFRMPKLDKTPIILDNEHIEILFSCLPNRFGVYDLTLVYSTFTHGISMGTMYRKMEEYGGPALLIVEDTDGYKFGAFMSVYLRPETHFYGTGESFLFKLSPSTAIFPWSTQNDFFISGGQDYIGFGGGSSGKFGLWLDDNFLNGCSYETDTYNNTCLSKNNDFKCRGIEIWGFTHSK